MSLETVKLVPSTGQIKEAVKIFRVLCPEMADKVVLATEVGSELGWVAVVSDPEAKSALSSILETIMQLYPEA